MIGNDDVGAPPPVGPTILPAVAELGEPDLCRCAPQAQRKPARKLPAALPPGMPAGTNQAGPMPKIAGTASA